MKLISILLLSYLIGSIPFGLLIGKIFFNKNLREYGSGNTGATNTFRILGTKAGIIVLLLDMFKGTIATLLPLIFRIHEINPLIFGACAVLGHTFPVFFYFKGGKAVATSGGALLGYNPWLFIFVIVVFLLFLFLTSMVSFASLGVSISTVFLVLFSPIFHWFIIPKFDLLLDITITILASFIWIRHFANFKRILNKTESTVSFGLGFFSNKRGN
ncbi:MAG: glycerol-3-phosphate 1-O-acyltransferase PlsY [Streptococcaceae bacterium]|jgi:glycerol-3-phosphate acyltransferase PlsY|nr:glycerol-3-phosphate 1-O-acyltransferase PlsY [Streptococcaceae bacterium]